MAETVFRTPGGAARFDLLQIEFLSGESTGLVAVGQRSEWGWTEMVLATVPGKNRPGATLPSIRATSVRRLAFDQVRSPGVALRKFVFAGNKPTG